MNWFKNIFSKNDTPSFERTLRNAFDNVRLFYYDIKINYKKGAIYIYDAPNDIYVKNRQVFYNAYFEKAKKVIISHLLNDYRLLLQEEIQQENAENNNKMVIDFESVESKSIVGSQIVSLGYEIALMNSVFWDNAHEPH